MQRVRVLGVLSVLWWSTAAWGNCVTLALTDWTAAQKAVLNHVAAQTAPEGVTITPQGGDTFQICAATTDLSTLTSAGLQTQAQALLDAQAAAATTQAQEQAALESEASTNPVCNATSLQDALDKIAIQKDAIQADIDAIDLATLQANVNAIDLPPVQTLIDAATNIATAKTAMTAILTELNDTKTALTTSGTNQQRVKTAMTTANNRLTAIDTNVVRCVFVLLKKMR